MNTIQQALDTLRKIQNERTHCQCSREKVVEKLAFDRVIKTVSESENVAEAINKLSAVHIEPTTRERQILKTAYTYGIAVLRKYADE